MPERVRLVVFDLDETFWKGTLAEGPIEYDAQCHNIVIELARRGIVSSICSKNDHEKVRAVLEEHGLWEYFIFPTINWESKGPRLQALIDTVQLRPATVLFIDDNHLNLREAEHFVPGLQVSDESIIAGLLQNPLFVGKDDSKLTRLKQYKLLETRKADEIAATHSGNNHEFLRSTDLRVVLDYDIEPNLDRAVELINRTNQLNFTKRRLPEDPEEARRELLDLVNSYDIQAGLVKVTDRYGDYGYCGFYAIRVNAGGRKLLHYAFSCRILNMGVETWLYRQLSRPSLQVVGEVLSDVVNNSDNIDWINATSKTGKGKSAGSVSIGEVVARGGCNLSAISHYFSTLSGSILGEFNIERESLNVRRDHSIFLRHAANGLLIASHDYLAKLGYAAEDFQTALFAPARPKPVWLLAFWADADFPIYRHVKTGVQVPFCIPSQFGDLRSRDFNDLPTRFQTPFIANALEVLRREFEYESRISVEQFRENISTLLSRAPADARIFVVGAPEVRPEAAGQAERPMPWKIQFNRELKSIVTQFPNVRLLNIADFVKGRSDLCDDPNHFARIVYYRIAELIIEDVSKIEHMAAAE